MKLNEEGTQMIRIERRQTDKADLAIKDLQKAKAKHITYNTENVNAALHEIFHGKCYICENKHGSSYQIEHLIPHHGKEELKYDWNNLFWACAHCNNTKSGCDDVILDCTKEDVDQRIAFRKEGYFGTTERFVFVPLDEHEDTKNTVTLLQNVYYGTTPQKKIEARILRKQLRENVSKFKGYIRDYEELEQGSEEKEDLEILIKRELSEKSEFTAFKRWLIRDNEKLAELLKYCGGKER